MTAFMLEQDAISDISQQLDQAHPQEILEWAVEAYGHSLVVVTSCQPTGIVTLHMMQEIAADVPVITLDTGLLFPETHALMDRLETRFGIEIQRVQPEQTITEQAGQYGDALWKRDPDHCCYLRKVRPLRQTLAGYEAWVTGLRRDQSPRRANTPIVSWDEQYQMVKLCPFATWTESMVWTYIQAHDLPYNALHDRGYPSIGCQTCTRAVSTGDDTRTGRWSGQAKTECGIHYFEKTG
jgi:phosphoadenosine phosphosulfate reductase